MKNPRADVGIGPYGPELKEISNEKSHPDGWDFGLL